MQINVETLSIIVLLLVQIGLGVYVLSKTAKTPSGISFAFFCFSLSIWALGAYLLGTAKTPLEVEIWGRFIFLGPVPIAFFFLYFSFVFPHGQISRLFRVLLSLPMLAFLFMVPTNLILQKGDLSVSGPIAIWGKAYPLFGVYFLIYFSWGVINFIRKYRFAKGNERIQIRYVFLGLFLAFVFGITFNLILPALGVAKFVSLGPYFTLFIVGFTAYAMVKHRLMDVSVIISRAVAEFLAVAFHGAIYLTLTYFYRLYISAQIDPLFIIWTTIYGIIVGQTHQNLRLFFQTSADKLFLHGKYDYYRALAEASSKVGQKLSLEHILEVIYDTFANVVEIANPRVFLPENFAAGDEGSTNFVVYDKKNYQPVQGGAVIGQDGPLARKLIEKKEVSAEAKELNAALIIPCFVEERLVAFFALGPKLSEEHYTYEDLRLIETLASQAAIALDHTRSYEKIKIDLEATERQLERSQRLASLGTLTAGVTHEIRNPLTVIRAETERLTTQPRDLEYLKNYKELLLKHITRIEGIVQRMLGLAREKDKRIAEINLKEMLDEIIPLFNFDGIKLAKELQPVRAIKADPEELQEVFVNLVQNAMDAMGHTGTITLRTREENGKVVAEVSDTGKGIPPELKEKIFDPFFSTRHEGVGLGLSIVYRIVREHGGDIQVISEVGKGTTFRLIF